MFTTYADFSGCRGSGRTVSGTLGFHPDVPWRHEDAGGHRVEVLRNSEVLSEEKNHAVMTQHDFRFEA